MREEGGWDDIAGEAMEADLVHLLGQKGVVNTSDTEAVTGDFVAILVVEEVVITITESGATGSVTSWTAAAGTVIPGRITGYTLASGKVRAYRR